MPKPWRELLETGRGSGQEGKKNVLLGCSGSVATLKVPELTVALHNRGFHVIILCTEKAKFFLQCANEYSPSAFAEFISLGGKDLVVQDKDEWDEWSKIGDNVLHIELRKWADVFLIAPASADLLSKACVGISDNVLLSVMRAWDFSKPCLLSPAMNTLMWEHPSTEESLAKLRSWGWGVIDPIDKVLACKDKGVGAMASMFKIVFEVQRSLSTVHKQTEIHGKGAVHQSHAEEHEEKKQTSEFSGSFYSGVGVGVGLGVSFILAIGVVLAAHLVSEAFAPPSPYTSVKSSLRV